MEENHKQVMDTLTRAITKANKTRSTRLSHVEVVDIMMAGAGGAEKAARLAGRILNKAMRLGLREDAPRPDRALALNAASSILATSATAEKARPPIDLSDLTQDEWRDIMLPCARQLILSDPVFRRELIDLTDVRKALLAEVNVEVLDLEAANNG
jgi:hypothetical protein